MTLATRYRVLAVFTIVVLTVFGVAALTTTGGDKVKSWEGVQVGPPDFACTSSLPFEAMPAMSLPFDLNQKGQVVLLFQGQFGGFSSTPGARAIIQLTIDGVVVGSAAAIGNDHGVDLQTFGYNAFGSVSAGPHVAEVQWHTFPPGATSCVEERSLILLRP